MKRIVGDSFEVSADILKPGHDSLRAYLNYREKRSHDDESGWKRTKMSFDYDKERWNASFLLPDAGEYEYEIQAWVDKYMTLVQNISKKVAASLDKEMIKREFFEDVVPMIESAISKSEVEIQSKKEMSKKLDRIKASLTADQALIQISSDEDLAEFVNDSLERTGFEKSRKLSVIVEPKIALFGAWYEMFHRSQGRAPGRSATFADCEARLGEIKKMGFDVIYLPPIHPIGRKNRRGPNNTPNPSPDAPGSPWAIGNNEQGGHMSINPDLGTFDDFAHFVKSANSIGIQIALDLAFQCSPDHPYVKEHPDWFLHQKDGSIKFAENPPKKYYDIVPFYFENPNWRELYEELFNIVMFWIQRGITIFRVDNPHTKPVGFWKWLISRVKEKCPDAIFLAEAFTRPKEMKLLAKLGFSQSYTYFTWKNTKYELEEFLKEYMLSEIKEYYRGNFFTNTPDILSSYLQNDGRNAFKIRLTLAATLSATYGIYNGFELCENRPAAPGSEEYLDSEKYDYKVWDWNRAGNIKEFISKMNEIRRENPALQGNNLQLLKASNENVMFYSKWNEDKSNIILVAINLDPVRIQESIVSIPLKELGVKESPRGFVVHDLISDTRFEWKGESNYVRLDPNIEPAHVLRVEM